MTCYHPLQAHFGALLNSGKRKIVFKEEERQAGASFFLPCGKCVGCRLERSRQWAMRCMHESKLHTSNCYVTLTYSEDRLPSDRSLNVRHFQLFMKRLRRKYPREVDNGIRFFHCGEYSPEKRRPHYHACIFNFDFPDRKYYKMSKGNRIDTSQICDDLWMFGNCYIGNVTFESAAYVARYIVDKINGPDAFEHYTDKESGVCLKPEYVTMSRRPGIGSKWLDKYFSDVYPSDEVIVRGRPMKPPKYYDSKLEIVLPELHDVIKVKRSMESEKNSGIDMFERLDASEKIKLSQLELYKRK